MLSQRVVADYYVKMRCECGRTIEAGINRLYWLFGKTHWVHSAARGWGKCYNKTGKLDKNSACRFQLSSKSSDTDVTWVVVNTGVLFRCQLKAS